MSRKIRPTFASLDITMKLYHCRFHRDYPISKTCSWRRSASGYPSLDSSFVEVHFWPPSLHKIHFKTCFCNLRDIAAFSRILHRTRICILFSPLLLFTVHLCIHAGRELEYIRCVLNTDWAITDEFRCEGYGRQPNVSLCNNRVTRSLRVKFNSYNFRLLSFLTLLFYLSQACTLQRRASRPEVWYNAVWVFPHNVIRRLCIVFASYTCLIT